MHYSSVCQFGGTLPISQPAPKKAAREKERGREGECRQKRKRKNRRGGGDTRTKEQVRHTQKSGNQSLGCSEGKHPNQISSDPARLLPICFDIPSPARLVECRLRTIPVLKTLKSINNTEGAKTTGREWSSGTRAAVSVERSSQKYQQHISSLEIHEILLLLLSILKTYTLICII